MRGIPGLRATKSTWVKNIASSACNGEAASRAACSMRVNSCSATQSITACQIASLLAKCRNRAPWVSFMRCAMAAVVISLGFCSAASAMTASTVTARRASAGRCLGCSTGHTIVSNYLLSLLLGVKPRQYLHCSILNLQLRAVRLRLAGQHPPLGHLPITQRLIAAHRRAAHGHSALADGADAAAASAGR